MKNAWRWLGALCLIYLVMAGAMTTLAQVPPGYEPEVRLLNPQEFRDNSANQSGESALVGGDFGAAVAESGSFKSWLADHGMGLVKGIGAGLIGAAIVVGVAALVVGAGAPLLLMASAAVVGGALYGLFTGSARFNWTEAIVGSVIGGISAGVGNWIAGMGSSLWTRAGVAAVDMIGGGLAGTASYLIHEPNPTFGGAVAAFGVGAGTAAMFMGAGAVISKGWTWAKGALGIGGAGKSAPKSAMVEAALAEEPVGGALPTTAKPQVFSAGDLGSIADSVTPNATRSGSSQGLTERALTLKRYLRDIEDITGSRIPVQQRRLLKDAVKGQEFRKLGRDEQVLRRKEFQRIRKNLIAEWEQNTGRSWPKYTKPVVSKEGEVLRQIGDNFDAHHVIELSHGGPNEWWNIHPASFPDQHQGGIHRADGILRRILE